MIPPKCLSTTSEIPGRSIERNCGVVTAECVLGINVLRDMLGAFRDFFGGRSRTHQKSLAEAKRTCFNEMMGQAVALGGDAIVGIRMDYEELAGGGKSGMMLLGMCGTAVELKSWGGANG